VPKLRSEDLVRHAGGTENGMPHNGKTNFDVHERTHVKVVQYAGMTKEDTLRERRRVWRQFKKDKVITPELRHLVPKNMIEGVLDGTWDKRVQSLRETEGIGWWRPSRQNDRSRMHAAYKTARNEIQTMSRVESFKKKVRPVLEQYKEWLSEDNSLTHRNTMAAMYIASIEEASNLRDIHTALKELKGIFGHQSETKVHKFEDDENVEEVVEGTLLRMRKAAGDGTVEEEGNPGED